jgi:hypothetical protein
MLDEVGGNLRRGKAFVRFTPAKRGDIAIRPPIIPVLRLEMLESE